MLLNPKPGTWTLTVLRVLPQILPGAAYCVASASMILLNKLALSSFDFHSVTMLLLFQCTFCVSAVKVTELLGLVELEVRGGPGCARFCCAEAMIGRTLCVNDTNGAEDCGHLELRDKL